MWHMSRKYWHRTVKHNHHHYDRLATLCTPSVAPIFGAAIIAASSDFKLSVNSISDQQPFARKVTGWLAANILSHGASNAAFDLFAASVMRN